MAAVAEPVSARTVSGDLFADRGKLESASFAESFSERVGESGLLQKNSSAGKTATMAQDFNSTMPGKKSDEVSEMLDVVKGNAIATLKVSANGELKSSTADKIVQPQMAAVTEVPEKTAARDSGLKSVEPSEEGDKAADDVLPNSVPVHAPTGGLTNERPVPHVNIADEDRALVLSGGGIAAQKEIKTAGEMKESVSAKKVAKTQGSVATSMTARKIVGSGLSATSKSALSPVMEGAIPGVIPMAQGVVTVVAAPQSGDSKAMDEGLSNAVSDTAKTWSGVAPTADAFVRKDVAHGTKTAAMDVGSGVPFTNDQLASLKSGVGLEEMAAIATPVSTDSDGKTQSVPGLTMSPVHVMTGGSPANAPEAVMSGHMKGDLTAAKLPIAEASVHSTGLPLGPREQDGPNIIATSMDGMPRMLTATPTALEVGIQNGTHGWLKVRAEMADGGVVNASVSAASSAGQEMLHRELPAMTAYLQEEKVAVNAIVVHAPLAAGAESGSSTGMDGAGGQTPQRNSEEGEQQNVGKSISDGSDKATTYRSLHGIDEDGSLSLATYASGGNWLSVRA